jgi:hypothetical protein
VSAGDVVKIHLEELMGNIVRANNDSAIVTADYGNSTYFYIDSPTPGLYLTADSGHDDATPKTAVDKAWTLYE